MENNKVAEAIFEEAPTWVCWEIEHCPVPKGCKAEEIAHKLSSALRELNYRGPISISAYGNMNHIPPSIKKALSSTGVVLNHVALNSRAFSTHMMDELFGWSRNNRPPANLLFITRYNADMLSYMQESGYNTLLAHPSHASDSFVAYAKTTWMWKNLLQ